jgi:hypothetical protein
MPMRKIIEYTLVSVDGVFADPDPGGSWAIATTLTKVEAISKAIAACDLSCHTTLLRSCAHRQRPL